MPYKYWHILYTLSGWQLLVHLAQADKILKTAEEAIHRGIFSSQINHLTRTQSLFLCKLRNGCVEWFVCIKDEMKFWMILRINSKELFGIQIYSLLNFSWRLWINGCDFNINIPSIVPLFTLFYVCWILWKCFKWICLSITNSLGCRNLKIEI